MGQYNMASYPGQSLVQVWNDVVPAQGGEVVVSGTAVVTETVELWSGPGTPKSLRVYPGDLVQPAAGVTLTINAPIRAGRWRIFDLSQGGSVVLGPYASNGIRPEWFGAAGNGSDDDLAALQAMAAALPAGAQVLLSGTYRIVYDQPAPVPPTPTPTWPSNDAGTFAIKITQPDVWVVGEGGACIFMDGFTYETACQYLDTAGLDRYTAISFTNTTGGGVVGVQFKGNGTGTPLCEPGTGTGGVPYVFVSRAKGVGIQDSIGVTVRDVSGSNLVGNVVNARGDNGTGSRRILVTGCYASTCSENGFNYMGGTFNCTFSDNLSTGNGFSGFETGTVGITCTGNQCYDNQLHGINHVGLGGTFVGNTMVNNQREGFVFQGNTEPPRGEQTVVSGNVISGNATAGIISAQGSCNNLITGNYLYDNGPASGALGIALEMTAGTPSDHVISGNFIQEDRADLGGAVGVTSANADGLSVTGNSFDLSSGHSVQASTGNEQVYAGNVANQTADLTNGATTSGNVGF